MIDFLRRRLSSRAILMLALCAALAATFLVLAPSRVAACDWETEWWQTFYAEPEQINVVGECWRPCYGWPSCWGTRTDYYNLVSYSCGGGECSP